MARSKKKLEKEILQNLQDNARWNIIVPPNDWLCPFCGEIGAEDLSMKGKIEKKILSHFMEGCTSWHFFEGEELGEDFLRQKANLIQLRREIPTNLYSEPAWQLSDKRGQWFCPFCLKPTMIKYEVEEGELISPEEEFVEHLEECEAFIERGGEAPDLKEVQARLEKFNKSLELYKLKKKILSKPNWQALDNGSHWHCPYCLGQTDIVFAHGKLDTGVLKKIHHHLKTCQPYKKGRGKVQPMEKIRQALSKSNRRRELQKLYDQINSDTLWQLITKDNQWFCPYCAEGTGIVVEDFDLKGALPEISSHLTECQSRKFSRDPRSFQEVKEKLQIYNTKVEILPFLRKKYSNPLFRCSLKGSGWVCPYCRQVQPHILLAGDKEINLSEMADHLSDSCPAFEPGEEPPVSLEELKAEMKGSSSLSSEKEKKKKKKRSSLTRRRKRNRKKLRQFQDEQKKLVRSLEDARQKQLRMLPDIPKIDDIEFHSLYSPCESVGGDFYDIIPLGEERMALVIGDVAGHGIDAALLVGMVKKILEIHGKSSPYPQEVLARAHEDLVNDLDEQTFITVFYAILDLRKRLFRMANGGHLPLILYNPEREVSIQKIHLEGIPLGIKDSTPYFQRIQESELELRSNDLILLYTDGLVETRDTSGNLYGEERLIEAIESYGKYELEYFLYKLEKELKSFRGKDKQDDDITILAFRLK